MHDRAISVPKAAQIAQATKRQLTELNERLQELSTSTELTGWVTNYYINLSGNTVDLNNPSRYENQYRYLVADCTPGESFIINGAGGSGPRLWGFIDSSNNVLSKALSSAVGDGLILTAPANSAKLIINDHMTGGKCYRGKPLQMIVGDNSNGIKSVEQADSFMGKYGLGEVYCASVRDAYPNDGYYVSAGGVRTGGASYHVCGLFPISAFADYTLIYSADFVSSAYPVGAFGADGTFLGTYPTTAPSETGVNNIKISDVAALYPSAKFFAVTESAVTAILTTGAAEKGSLFPVDLSVSFAAETAGSYNSNLLGMVSLGTGRYILKWVQETDTRKNILDSRLCPVYVNSSNVATYYHLTVENVVWDAGERYWVIDIETAGIYRFYFWGNQLTEAVTISGINLYSADSELGKIYLTKAEMQNKDDTLMAFPSMFQKIGFIGDSWTAGSLYGSNNQHVMTDFDASYASQMCRIIGSTPHCFAKGGLSAREWIDDTEIGLPALITTERQDLYWLNMGINDAGEINDGTGETGVGNPSDYDNGVTGTFCYYYGRIISEIKTYSPNSKIVVCDILQRSLYMVKIANVLPALCEYYGVPLVRMYDDAFYRSVKTASLIVGSHPTVAMHSGMALANIRLLSKCIREQSAYFNTFLPITN